VSTTAGPRFSAVIATYNQREYVLETVRSVLEQAYPAHEVIVVVDGSTDGTAEALRVAFGHVPSVRVIEQENAGKCVARNTGIAAATGEWICLLDHDDLWHCRKLEETAAYVAAHSECEAINHPLWFFSDDPAAPEACFGFGRDFLAKNVEECHLAIRGKSLASPAGAYLQIRGRSHEMLLERNRGALSASAVRRDVLITAGAFCPMHANGEDWAMFLGVARVTEWHTIPHRLAFIRLHAHQDTHQPEGSLMILAGQVAAWYMGRPLPRQTRGNEVIDELVNYAREYRKNVQGFFWGAIRRGDWRLARLILCCGRLLLPRRRDYALSLLPPQLTWRWERYILGMHK
jgi:glycosyltransferase involved in cell wall biosynthesis